MAGPAVWTAISVDGVELQARICTPVTYMEAQSLAFEPTMTVADAFVRVAPFVTEWNMANEHGELLTPPADCNGETFAYLPMRLFWEVYREIMYYVKRSQYPSPEQLEGM